MTSFQLGDKFIVLVKTPKGHLIPYTYQPIKVRTSETIEIPLYWLQHMFEKTSYM